MGRHGILHIVKVFPLPDSDLIADKIHGLSSRSSESYPDTARFLWKPLQQIITFKSVDYQHILYLFPMLIIMCKTGKAG